MRAGRAVWRNAGTLRIFSKVDRGLRSRRQSNARAGRMLSLTNASAIQLRRVSRCGTCASCPEAVEIFQVRLWPRRLPGTYRRVAPRLHDFAAKGKRLSWVGPKNRPQRYCCRKKYTNKDKPIRPKRKEKKKKQIIKKNQKKQKTTIIKKKKKKKKKKTPPNPAHGTIEKKKKTKNKNKKKKNR